MMDMELYSKAKKRMCSSHRDDCSGCILDGSDICDSIYGVVNNPKVYDDVINWAKEHPPATYLDDFKSKFPNCNGSDSEICDRYCRKYLYNNQLNGECEEFRSNCNNFELCIKCWNMEMEK